MLQTQSSSSTFGYIGQLPTPSSPHRSRLPSRLVIWDDSETLPLRQLRTNLLLVVGESSSVVDLFESLAGERPTHVCRLGGWEQRAVTQGVDALLPLFAGVFGWVDELDVLADAVVDCISDPAALDLYGTSAYEGNLA